LLLGTAMAVEEAGKLASLWRHSRLSGRASTHLCHRMSFSKPMMASLLMGRAQCLVGWRQPVMQYLTRDPGGAFSAPLNLSLLLILTESYSRTTSWRRCRKEFQEPWLQYGCSTPRAKWGSVKPRQDRAPAAQLQFQVPVICPALPIAESSASCIGSSRDALVMPGAGDMLTESSLGTIAYSWCSLLLYPAWGLSGQRRLGAESAVPGLGVLAVTDLPATCASRN